MSAFETRSEAELVDALREKATLTISFVAEENEKIVGHIFFSPVTLSDDSGLKICGLAPMAVEPALQCKGIGSKLVREGLAACKMSGFKAVIVLGHPNFYPRFGFVPASHFGIDSDYDVPDEVFMALELESGALDRKQGRIRYHAAFGNV